MSYDSFSGAKVIVMILIVGELIVRIVIMGAGVVILKILILRDGYS